MGSPGGSLGRPQVGPSLVVLAAALRRPGRAKRSHPVGLQVLERPPRQPPCGRPPAGCCPAGPRPPGPSPVGWLSQ
eukprot:15052199-Alexandrium_andersonii.AAC.1